MSKYVRYLTVTVCASVFVAVVINELKRPARNNVCSSISDYFNVNTNPNCWYDPDVDSNVTDIIKNHNYDSETHKVVTKDGYILTIFRIIPKENKRAKLGPLYLHHGLADSSISFLELGNESIAFVLADAGYDVWLGNGRGSYYSREHVNLSVNEYKYWNFSYHEVSVYDLPAAIELINGITKEKIIFIGYSLGSSVSLVYTSIYSDVARKYLKFVVSLAPGTTNRLMKNPWYIVGKLALFLDWLFPKGFCDLVFDITGKNSRFIISYIPMYLQIKFYQTPMLYFFKTVNFNTIKAERIPNFLSHKPHGTSFQTVIHSFSNPFNVRMYDHGKDTNLAIYGKEEPPFYDFAGIKIPYYVIYSENDKITRPEDVLYLYHQLLPKSVRYGIHKIDPTFMHSDFLIGTKAKEEIYDHILKVISEFNSAN